MKSRTSSFNLTIFKKNLTRFAPCWGLYTVGALMALILLVGDGSNWMADNLVGAVHVLCVITPIYAMICAQLLFGDLYSTRMCNALHALPLKRETWFFTNVISGFVFHLIPTGILTVLVTPILAFYCPEGSVWAAPTFLLGTFLQFTLFFGLSVFCGFCVGSRFAQGLLYAILNFGSIIAGWLINTIFVPMYYGIRINTEPFQLFSPIVFMANAPFAYVERIYRTDYLNISDLIGVALHPDDGTVYYFIVAALGIGLLFAAMALYRRRKLECAGDFLAEKAGEPVFLVIYSLVIGCVFHFVWRVFIGDDTPILLFVGLVIGFFTGQMLLSRTVRVFNLKALGGCAVLAAALGLSLGMTALDPLGIESWMPEPTEVKSVKLYQYHSLHDSPGNAITLDSTEDIEAILQVHEAAMELEDAVISTEGWIQLTPKDEKVYIEKLRQFQFTLEYRLENGGVVRRYYKLWRFMEEADILKGFFTSVKCVLGVQESELPQLAQELDYIQLDTYQIYDYQERLSLLQAIAADCKAGTMAQNWVFRGGDDTWETVMDIYCAANMERLNSGAWYYGPESFQINIQVFDQNENILNWMKEHNVPTYQYIELGK